MSETIRTIRNGEHILAIIIPSRFERDGIEFFTPNEFSQQLAYMRRPEGYIIEPHVHLKVERSVFYTLETLFIRKGKVRIDFYSAEKTYLESTIAETGDVVLLVTGGHGFTMLEETEMIEVKQGPYASDKDKERFKGVSNV